jgi:hypothetical protein
MRGDIEEEDADGYVEMYRLDDECHARTLRRTSR